MKKALLALAVVVVVVLAIRIWPHNQGPTAPAVQRPAVTTPSAVVDPDSAEAPPASSNPSSRPYSTTTGAVRAWEPVVEGLALAYPDTRGLTRRQWLANLRPYLAPAVLNALTGTDLEKVPTGHYAGYEILRQADETVTVRALYRQGWALDLYLTQIRPNHWRVDTLDSADDFD